MKKILFTLALFVQVGFAMATDKSAKVLAQARENNVKMYQQPGTSTTVLKVLNTTDRIEVVRKLNAVWTIVSVNGQAGYVLHSELTKPQYQDLAVTRTNR
jgi:hypothetical protein